VTKLSTKIARAAKRVTSLLSAAAIAVVGLVATSAAPAQAAAVTKPQYVNINRSPLQDGSITIHNGETLRVYISLNANFTSDGAKQATTNAAITPGTGLTTTTASYRWELNGCPGAQSTVQTPTATPCASATGLNVYITQNITNSSGSDKSITSNSETATVSYGGTPLTTFNPQFSSSRQASNTELTSGVVYADGDSYMNGSFELCFASGAIAANDVLTWDVTTLNGTTPVSNEYSMNNPYIQLRYSTMMSSSYAKTGDSYTVTVNAPSTTPPTSLYVDIQGGRLTAGTYHFSVDLKKNGSSVLGTCNYGPGPGGPVSLLTGALGSAAGVANAAIAEKSLGANITTSGMGAHGEDGQGGLLVVSPAVAAGSYTIANLTATGPKANFGGSGKITLTPADSDSMVDAPGWFGAAQSGWAASFSGMMGGTEVFWGSKANATVKRKSFTMENVSQFCASNAPAGYSSGHFGGMMESPFLSAPTTDPMMFMNCYNEQTDDEKGFLVKITTSGMTKVVSTSSATTTVAKPCTRVDTFVNPAATTTKVAALLIIGNKAKGMMGGQEPTCYSSSGEFGNRRITTITAAGGVKVYTANIPTTAIPAAATSVSLSAGSVAGTWVGVVRSGTPSKATHTIKITATGTVSKLKNITLDAASVFSQSSYIVPVKQLANGSIIAVRTVSVPGMAPAYKYAVAKIDVNGKVTTGKVFTLTAAGMMDSWSAKNISRMSVSATGVVNYYFVSKYTETANGNKIKVVTWSNPKS
jgi:hypothetical protein